MSTLEFHDIHRAFTKGVDVLDGISFSLDAGEVVGLLGRNGAGKTTLIRTAMGLLQLQQGRVRVFGLDPRVQSVEVKRRVGYVSEDQILPGFMTVEEVIRLHRGLFPAWDTAMERDLRERFELPSRARIRTLSKGQARQVALLCAVSHRPELLILDEPAGGLDPAARREFLETAIRLLGESGSTILFSSHHMPDVERMAGRVVLIHKGRLLLDNDLDELREHFSLAMLPPNERLTAETLRGLDHCLGVRERADGLHVVLRLDPEQARETLARRFGVTDVRLTRIALEEMFVELVGRGA